MKTAKWLTGLGWVLGIIVMSGCGSADPTKNAANDKSGTVFHNLSLDKALSKAKTDKKLVMIDFYADWCGPCKMLDKSTWQDSKVQDWLRENTVAIKIDVDKEEELAEKYSTSSIPVLVFLKPDGSEVGRLVGYHSAEAFLQKAGELLAAKKVASK